MDQETINKRIAEEQAKIVVPSYQDVTFDGAFKRRTNSMFGLAVLGLVTGAAIGLAAPAAAVIGGAAMTGALVAKSAMIFSAIGMSAGWGMGALVGPSAGAAASAMKEYERRTLAREVEEKIRENPEASVTLAPHPAVQPESSGGIRDYINPRAAMAFAIIGAVAGLVFAGALVASGALAAGTEAAPAITAYAMPAMKMLLGSAATSVSAVVAYSVGVGASFGAIFGVNYPKLSRATSDFFGDMLSGKAVDSPWPPGANLPTQQPVLAPVVEVEKPAEKPSKLFAPAVLKKEDYATLVKSAPAELLQR